MPDEVPPEVIEQARVVAFLRALADNAAKAITNPVASGAAQAALCYAAECIAANMHAGLEVEVVLARRAALN